MHHKYRTYQMRRKIKYYDSYRNLAGYYAVRIDHICKRKSKQHASGKYYSCRREKTKISKARNKDKKQMAYSAFGRRKHSDQIVGNCITIDKNAQKMLGYNSEIKILLTCCVIKKGDPKSKAYNK